MSKCCFIHFKPTRYKEPDNINEDLNLVIDDIKLKKVKKAKFLGVIIDENLTWVEHVKNLKRNLNYATATLNRIKDSLPSYLHKEIYYTLFESHMSYCISVWGGAAQSILTPIWMSQKHCIRVLFGDKEAYLDKFKTCVRARPIESQVLDSSFYEREHTKPLFKQNNILSLHNLYNYHCFMETFKILKLRIPIVFHSQYHIAFKKHTRLIPPIPSPNFLYRSSIIWNKVSQKLKLFDYSTNMSIVRNQMKKALLYQQHVEETIHWTPEDFNIDKIALQTYTR